MTREIRARGAPFGTPKIRFLLYQRRNIKYSQQLRVMSTLIYIVAR